VCGTTSRCERRGRIGGRPTFGYAFAHLAGAHLDASVPTSRLRANRLLVIEPGVPALEAELTIDDRILSYLLGVPTIDERLLPHILQTSDAGPLTSEQLEVVGRLEGALGATSWIQLHGGEQSTRLALLRAAATRRGLQLLVLRAGSLALVATEAELLRRLVEREGRLGDWLPTLTVDPFDTPMSPGRFARLRMASPCRVRSRRPTAFRSPSL